MSGGHFEYIQYRFTDVVDDIEQIVKDNGRELSMDELKERCPWNNEEYYEKYPEEKCMHKYSDKTIEEFNKGIEIIKKAQTYMQRIDWLLSGDDGEESFHSRLAEELNENI